MPLFTRPHFSDKQIVQFSGETITLSGITNFDGVLKSKGIEIDATVSNPSIQDGYVLKFEEASNKIVLLPDDSGVPGLTNAQNGLGVIGSTVVLGGTLLSGTTVNINGFPFVLTGGTLALQDLEIQGIGIDTTPVNNTQNLYLKYNSGTNRFEPAELVEPDTITAENGLTKINNVIVLGGELNQATTVNQLGFPLIFTGDTVFLQALDIDGVGIELKHVNNTQNLYLKYNSGTNKFEPAQLVIPNNITASNGISKVGDDIRLGGTLSQATTIQQSGFPLLLTGGTVGVQRLEVQGIKIDTTPVNNTQNLFLKYNSSQTKFEPSVIDYSDIVNVPSVNNGLVLTGNTIQLGGSLVRDTDVLLSNFGLSLSKNILSGFNGTVRAIAAQSNGKILVGGAFTSYNSIEHNRIIRLNTDGSVDNSFVKGVAFDNTVNTIFIQQDGKILVGGDFITYNNVTSNSIVRLNIDGTRDNTFNASIFSGVEVIKVNDNGIIYVGGRFGTVNSTFINRIVALDPNGTINSSFSVGSNGGFTQTPQPPSFVTDIAIQPDGKLLVIGNFINYIRNSQAFSARRIIRLNADASIDTTFLNIGVEFNATTLSVKLQGDGKILVGGQFTSYNSVAFNRIIRLNSDGTIDNSFNIGSGFNSTVNNIFILPNNKILVGGAFTSYNSVLSNGLILLNSNGSVDTTFDIGSGFNGFVQTIFNQNGTTYIGGNFSLYNNNTSNRFIALNSIGTPVFGDIDSFELIFNEKLANYKEKYHELYDDRTLVDKEYVDIEVFDVINDNFQLSGATNGMALVFNSGTTKYQPSFVDYNTLLNVPVVIPTTYGNTAFVSPAGNNATAVVGRFDRPYATIQQAVNAASANGSICIVEGTYSESLTINKQLKFTSLGRVQISGTHTITSTTVEFDNIRLKQASVAVIFTASNSTITLKNLEVDTAGSFVASATGTSTIIARNVYSNKNLTNGTFTNERPFNFAVDGTFTI